jgi:hypothetical protein
MISDVYNAKILGYAGNIPRIGRLDTRAQQRIPNSAARP